MNSGFVIFRDPVISKKIQGWRGEFANFSEPFVSDKSTFFIQAWDKKTPVSGLNVVEKTDDKNLLKLWFRECNLVAEFQNKEISQSEFEQFILFSKTAIAQGDFEKIVAARNRIQKNEIEEIESCFYALCTAYPDAFISLISHPNWGTWIGASPELLLHWKNNTGETVALAGTLVKPEDSWTSKEEKEQHTIADFLHQVFQKFKIENVTEAEKLEVKQGALTHIAQKFHFPLAQKSIGDFLMEIHPTPAVGGFAQKDAIAFIERFENLNRELFTGWLGWSNENVFHSWVNLRCAKIGKTEIQFFAGCGINSGSNAQKEWEEAEAKMAILRNYL
ncbi:MAG: chorismate-binding protein [Bacteroidetes bacterium]|nr:chorismate-binding protein [Bacteroidota bacterium]